LEKGFIMPKKLGARNLSGERSLYLQKGKKRVRERLLRHRGDGTTESRRIATLGGKRKEN